MFSLAIVIKPLKVSVIMLLLLSVLTGLLYPGFITLLAQILFPTQSNGSLLLQDQKVIGSKLIGQNFASARYFAGRPSTTPDTPYNGAYSSGSNMGPSNPKYLNTVQQRILELQNINQTKEKVPIDLVLSSGSGLDPDISVEAALFQVSRISKARNLPERQIVDLIRKLQKGTLLNIFGTEHVNVLELNLALDSAVNTKKDAQ